jgi:hypothetical protein
MEAKTRRLGGIPSLQWVGGLLMALLLLLPGSITAQEPIDSRRPVATRPQLQQSLADAEAIANSPAYSEAFRQAKQLEAAKVRERLIEGDFYVGDDIMLRIDGDTALTGGLLQVRPGRVLQLPGLPDIPLRGVLRSELEGYLTEQLTRFIKSPQVSARPQIRLTILGGVGAPGFHQLDAEMLLSDALNAAGGIGNATDLPRSKIVRDGQEILNGEEFALAITEGTSLDQLNLRAGDVIDVGVQTKTNWLTTTRTILAIPALIVSIYGLGRLFNVW